MRKSVPASVRSSEVEEAAGADGTGTFGWGEWTEDISCPKDSVSIGAGEGHGNKSRVYPPNPKRAKSPSFSANGKSGACSIGSRLGSESTFTELNRLRMELTGRL